MCYTVDTQRQCSHWVRGTYFKMTYVRVHYSTCAIDFWLVPGFNTAKQNNSVIKLVFTIPIRDKWPLKVCVLEGGGGGFLLFNYAKHGILIFNWQTFLPKSPALSSLTVCVKNSPTHRFYPKLNLFHSKIFHFPKITFIPPHHQKIFLIKCIIYSQTN